MRDTSRANKKWRLGIDLGGTKIAAVILSPTDEVVANVRRPTPRNNYAETLRAIADVSNLAKAAVKSSNPLTPETCLIGVAMPGSISPATGHVQNANSTWLNNRPFATDLNDAIGQPVRVANDADCFALSESRDGAGKGATSLFGVILGTGCGGGLVHEGHLLTGPRSIGGEWGHNPLPWANPHETPGPSCWCGRHGCMETWVSGPGMASDHFRQFGEHFSAQEIENRAVNGCTKARQTLERQADRLARGLAHVINIIDPEVIVLGGGLSKMAHLYKTLPDLMCKHIFSADTTVDVRPPRWGDASGVRGAARLWDE